MEERAEYKTNYGKTLGLQCGVDNCTHNDDRRCLLEMIGLDSTGRCMSALSGPLSKSLIEWRKNRRKKQIESLLVDAWLCETDLKDIEKTIALKRSELAGLEKLDD